MRKLPTILAAAFIVITLWRVAEFAWYRMGAGVLGVLFSIVLGAGVFLTSYYTRNNVTRQDGKTDQRDRAVKAWAWVGLLFFVVVDAVFNMLEVWLSVNPQTPEMQAAAGLYGAFPTLASALLGALQGVVDRLPKAGKAKEDRTPSITAALRRLALAKIAAVAKGIRRNASEAEIRPAHKSGSPNKSVGSPTAKKYPCPHCVEVCDNPSALANHVRWNHTNGHAKTAIPAAAQNGNGAQHKEG